MPRPRRVSARSAARGSRATPETSVPEEATAAPVPQADEDKPTPTEESNNEDVEMETEATTTPTETAPAADPTPPAATAPSETEQDPEEETLFTDTSYLNDPALGYSPEDNLKQPLRGFTPEDEVQLFPVIDSMSSKLFTIVQKMSDDQKRDIEAAIKAKKGIIKISDHPKAFLYHLNYVEAPSEADKSKSSKRAPHPFLLTEDENIFSDDKLKMLRAVLDAGWKREVVMRSPGSTGRKTGDVYYYSPDGTKFRSSKQVAQHLSAVQNSPFTIDNFSFAKVRISTNPDQEIVRKAYDGKSPPRSPPKPVPTKGKPAQQGKADTSKGGAKASTSKESPESDTHSAVSDEPVKGVSSRRSIQPPKRYSGDAVLLLSKRSKVQDDKRGSNSNKGLMQMGMLPPKYPKGMEDSSSNLSESNEYNDSLEESPGSNSMAIKELADDSMFQISALRQSGRIDVDKMQKLVEKQLAQKAEAQAASAEESKQKQRGAATTTGGRPKREEVIPCSIRCPGMTGEIPNLQCTRCLCLYHAECLGLPLNLNYPNFLCSNCETEPGSSSKSSIVNPQETKKTMIIKKSGEMKRPPPPLVRATSLPRGPAPTRREVIVAMANKEATHARLPQKIGAVPSHIGMARGMIRGRGLSAPLVRSPSGQLQPGQRLITSADGSPAIALVNQRAEMLKRGNNRGRPAPRGLPQLNNKSLTITHLPRIMPKAPVGGPPPVPNLQPMSTPKGLPSKLALPVLPVKPRHTIPSVPNLMKPNAFKLTVPPPSLSGRTFKKVPSSSSQQVPQQMKLHPPLVNKPPPSHVYAQGQDRTGVTTIKRYPQSICTIGNKKFVVLPRKSRPDFPAATTITTSAGTIVVGNGLSTTKIVGEQPRAEASKLSSMTSIEVVPIPVSTTDKTSGSTNGASSQTGSTHHDEDVEMKAVPETEVMDVESGVNDSTAVGDDDILMKNEEIDPSVKPSNIDDLAQSNSEGVTVSVSTQ